MNHPRPVCISSHQLLSQVLLPVSFNMNITLYLPPQSPSWLPRAPWTPPCQWPHPCPCPPAWWEPPPPPDWGCLSRLIISNHLWVDLRSDLQSFVPGYTSHLLLLCRHCCRQTSRTPEKTNVTQSLDLSLSTNFNCHLVKFIISDLYLCHCYRAKSLKY